MLHTQTVTRWSAQPGFVNSLRRWTWCRDALPELMQRLAAAQGAAGPPAVDGAALARAFWPWAATLDHHALLEPLEPVDFAHFQVGMLLAQMLAQRPLRPHAADRGAEVRVLTDTALTLLAAWLQAIGAPPVADASGEMSPARWASYVENVNEDAGVAVAFLDLFTGREPVWSTPSMPGERPPLRRALEQRRTAV